MSPVRSTSFIALIAACTAGERAPRTEAATRPDPPLRVTVTATDYAFEAPDTIPPGFTTFRLVNESDQFHMAQLVKLGSGRTVVEFLESYGKAFRAVGPRPAWAPRLGGPGVADPRGESNATIHLEPGSYVWICLVNPPPDGIPHVMKGMAHAFVVPARGVSPSSESAPQAGVVIKLIDHGFNMSAPLTAGRHVIRVRNTGAEPHELGLVRLVPGKTVQDLETWTRNLDGPPPASAVGGVSSLAAGREAYFEVELRPGDYVLFCLVTAPDARSHVAHGMIRHVRID